MEANELRINNYVTDRAGKLLRIDWWENINKACMNIESTGHPLTEIDGYCKPIPLTEDWLLKFGFKKSEDVINQNNNYVNTGRYWIQQHIEADEFIFYGIDNSIELVLKHVHQLQNLYFALTGQELTIKE